MLIISVLINLVWSCDEWRTLNINLNENHNKERKGSQIFILLHPYSTHGKKNNYGSCSLKKNLPPFYRGQRA